mmetsp:Transcript_10836/g.24549  ORF Transcript_10836/g.24549 Transcript_10836/m.24549 type:complete len:806 (+) Transcript_10836:154-2571(+)
MAAPVIDGGGEVEPERNEDLVVDETREGLQDEHRRQSGRHSESSDPNRQQVPAAEDAAVEGAAGDAVESRADAPLFAGTLALEDGSDAEMRYFQIFADRLQYTASQEVQGSPLTIISFSDIQDLEVARLGFKVKHSGGRLSLKADSEANFNEWLHHFTSLLGKEPEAGAMEVPQSGQAGKQGVGGYVSAPADRKSCAGTVDDSGASPVCQSTLTIVEGSAKDRRYFVLYSDRLDCFTQLSDMVNGLDVRGRILIESIERHEVGSNGFSLRLKDKTIDFNVGHEIELLDAWSAAWLKVLDGKQLDPKASAPRTDGALHKGILHVRCRQRPSSAPGKTRRTSKEGLEARTFTLYDDRLEWWEGSENMPSKKITTIRVADVKGFDVIEKGFVLHLSNSRLELFVQEKRELQTWLSAWSTAKRRCQNKEMKFEMLPIGLFQDISVLGTPTVIRHGLLGMQEAGKLVQKYCVLYKGRMEFYSSVEDAKSAAVPATGTFWLEELSKIDHVGSGVVLSLEGKYVGLHADSEASSLEWARAIRTASLFGAAAEEPQFKSKQDTASGQLSTQRTSLRRSMVELRDSRGAARQAASAGRCAKPQSPPNATASAQGGLADADGTVSRTSKTKVEQSAQQFACVLKPEPREGGFGWTNREIAENVIQHEEKVALRHPTIPSVAEKVGVGSRSSIVRRRESFGQSKWEKISSKGDQAKASGSFRFQPSKREVVPATPHAISPWTEPKRAVSGKVTEAVTQFGQSWRKTSPLRPKTKPWETASKVQSVEASRTTLDKGQHELLAAQPAAGAPSGQPACS